MPALTLQVVSVDAAPVEQPIARAFDAGGGSIGRDDSNFLALPDKHRRVSRLHATISFPGGMPTITNSSTSLPLSVGEQQLDGGESMPITQGALIEIGPYILKAHVGALESVAAFPNAPHVIAQAVAPLDRPVTNHSMVPTHATGIPAADPLAFWSSPASIGTTPALSPAMPPMHSGSGGLLPDSFGSDFGALLAPSSAAHPTLSANSPSAYVHQKPNLSAATQADPFADLLAGIGGGPIPSASPASSLNSPAVSAPIAPAGMSADPLAAFGGTFPAQGDTFLGSSQPVSGKTADRSSQLLPDDFNAFHLPSDSSRNAADPLAGLLGSSPVNDSRTAPTGSNGTPSIDSLFQTGGSESSDAAFFGIAPGAGSGAGSFDQLIRSNADSDPMSLFDSLEAKPDAFAKPMRDDRIEIGSAFAPPLARNVGLPEQNSDAFFSSAAPVAPASVPAQRPYFAAPPVPPPSAQQVAPAATMAVAPQPTPMPSAPQAGPDSLTDAFLRGAGLAPGALPNGLTPEIMTVIGSLLRSATAGAVDMLAARAATKREVQASVTIISVQANNPLKFLPNGDSALLQLLGKKMPGFMRADVAMRDAFDDLRAHEVGVIAGTRAALTEVLGKFDPAVLGDKLARGSVLESLMPSARKAKLWDLYLERYLQIRREAEDDFQSIFGRAFVQAYERETARIKGESPTAGGER